MIDETANKITMYTPAALIMVPELMALVLSYYELNYYTFPVVVRSILGRTSDDYTNECIMEIVRIYSLKTREKVARHPNFSYLIRKHLISQVTDVASEIVGHNNMDRFPVNVDHKVYRLELVRDHDLTIEYTHATTREKRVVPKVDLARFPRLRELSIRYITDYYRTVLPSRGGKIKHLALTADESDVQGVAGDYAGLETLTVTDTIFANMLATPGIVPGGLKKLTVKKPIREGLSTGVLKCLLSPERMTKFGITIGEVLNPDPSKLEMVENADTFKVLSSNPSYFTDLLEYHVVDGNIEVLCARLNNRGTFIPKIDAESGLVDFSECTCESINRIMVRAPPGMVNNVIMPKSCLSLRDLRLPNHRYFTMPERRDENGVKLPSLRICRLASASAYNSIMPEAPTVSKLKLTWSPDHTLMVSSPTITRLKIVNVDHKRLIVRCPRLVYLWTDKIAPSDRQYVSMFIPGVYVRYLEQRSMDLIWRNVWSDQPWYAPGERIIIRDVYNAETIKRVLSDDEWNDLFMN